MARILAAFVTRHDDLPHTSGILVDGRDDAADLSAYATAAMSVRTPGIAAFGKIAIIRPEGVAVFQAGPDQPMAPAFCGNATAAALAWMNGAAGARIAVFGAAGLRHEIVAGLDGRTVSQTWHVPEPEIEERSWRGRRVFLLPTLNPYAIVAGALPAGVDAGTARLELLGPGLAAKLAVVAGDGPVPLVDFYNGNGRHGGVPQTGLASIALAARRVPFLAERFAAGHALQCTHRGVVRRPLPATSPAADGRIAVEMPRVTVDLDHVAVTAAA